MYWQLNPFLTAQGRGLASVNFSSDTGTFTYTHDGSNTVFDEFTYQVSDGNSQSNSATALIILPTAKSVFLPVVNR